VEFKVKKIIETPDGATHESVEAANAHMRGIFFETLGEATTVDFKDPEPELRNAVREAYLLMWPRADTGKPRGPRKPKEPKTSVEPGPELPPTEDPAEERETKPRNGKKKAA
jgi:hypothetical protein